MPWTPIHAQIHTLLKAKVLLPKSAAILMAVSGGQDSLSEGTCIFTQYQLNRKRLLQNTFYSGTVNVCLHFSGGWRW